MLNNAQEPKFDEQTVKMVMLRFIVALSFTQ